MLTSPTWTERETDAESDEANAGQQEISTSWSLFILIVLLILALFASYILQTRRIQAVHETVMSIFAGMELIRQESTDMAANEGIRNGCRSHSQTSSFK